jgi:small-conductance mechanosensitive channel
VIDRLADALSLSRWQAQLIVTGALLLALSVIRWVVLTIVHRRIEDSAIWYRTRKLTSYVVTIVGAVLLASIWLEGSGLATYIGFLTAGLAIALSDVLKNLAGWAYIVLRRPFRLGDRVEIDGRLGDVVDIRAFRFTMLEVAGRVDAEQATGRLLHVPNGLVFTNPLANFTEGFEYIWHEVPVLITFESDWEGAEQILLDIVKEHGPDMSNVHAARQLRDASTSYQIRFTHLTPTVYLTVRDSGVLLTGRLLVSVRELRAVEESIWKAILRAFGERPDIALAYPTVRTYLEGPLRLEDPGERRPPGR